MLILKTCLAISVLVFLSACTSVQWARSLPEDFKPGTDGLLFGNFLINDKSDLTRPGNAIEYAIVVQNVETKSRILFPGRRSQTDSLILASVMPGVYEIKGYVILNSDAGPIGNLIESKNLPFLNSSFQVAPDRAVFLGDFVVTFEVFKNETNTRYFSTNLRVAHNTFRFIVEEIKNKYPNLISFSYYMMSTALMN